MTLFLRDQENIEKGIQQGIEQGIERINKLNTRLIQDKRYDDLEHSTSNPNFQQQLMAEYKI